MPHTVYAKIIMSDFNRSFQFFHRSFCGIPIKIVSLSPPNEKYIIAIFPCEMGKMTLNGDTV